MRQQTQNEERGDDNSKRKANLEIGEQKGYGERERAAARERGEKEMNSKRLNTKSRQRRQQQQEKGKHRGSRAKWSSYCTAHIRSTH